MLLVAVAATLQGFFPTWVSHRFAHVAVPQAPKGGSLLRRPHEALLQSAGTTFRNAVERTAWCGVAFTSGAHDLYAT
jgi:hypothetical protein